MHTSGESVEILLGGAGVLKEFKCQIRSGWFGKQIIDYTSKNIENNLFIESTDKNIAKNLEKLAQSADDIKRINYTLQDITSLKGKKRVPSTKEDGSFVSDKEGNLKYDDVNFGE